MNTQPESQNVKKARNILWIGLILIILIGTTVAVYFIFLKSESEITATNINSSKKINCDLITDSDMCNARTDCLPVDTCECATQYLQRERCGLVPGVACPCATFFERCEALDCTDIEIAVVSNQIELLNGEVSMDCQSDNDCALVDMTKDYSDCCPSPGCTDYASDTWVAVNGEAAEQLISNVSEPCERKDLDCPQYVSPQCPDNNNENYFARCVGGICQKVFIDTEGGETPD